MTPLPGYLGAIAANGPVSLMVPSTITTAPAGITPDAPRRGSVIAHAPRMMMVYVIALHPCNRSPGPRDKGAAFPRACKSAPKTILWENPRRLRRGAEAIGRWYTPVSILARGTEGSNPPYSSGESVANLTVGGASGWRYQGRPRKKPWPRQDVALGSGP